MCTELAYTSEYAHALQGEASAKYKEQIRHLEKVHAHLHPADLHRPTHACAHKNMDPN